MQCYLYDAERKKKAAILDFYTQQIVDKKVSNTLMTKMEKIHQYVLNKFPHDYL